MNVLHLYPDTEPLIVRHVAILDQHSQNGNVQSGHTSTGTGEQPQENAGSGSPDIVHVHGCWQHKVVRAALRAHRQGARIVFTPHGGLEPWVIRERRMSEKLAKTLLWQRRLAECSYVMIAQGNMEAEALQKLNWNPRIETIRNAVVTNSITPEAMLKNTQDIYRKVMDSNTLELMSDDARRLLSLLLKAGITGDERWVSGERPAIDETEWRRLLIYANHENVRTTVDKGARILNLRQPYLETDRIKSYLPTDYIEPKVESREATAIVAEMYHHRLTLRHFVELDRALRRDNVEEDWLTEALEENRMLKYFRRLLKILTEQTLLDEGFLPAKPLDDRLTQRLRKQLYNHLRI